MSSKYFNESITVTGGAAFDASAQERFTEALVVALQAQGRNPEIITVQALTNNVSGSAVKCDYFADLRVAAPGGHLIAGETVEFTVHTDDVFVFLGRINLALGVIAKNFINGVGNVNLNSTQAPSAEDLVRWVNDFRDVFPRLEAAGV